MSEKARLEVVEGSCLTGDTTLREVAQLMGLKQDFTLHAVEAFLRAVLYVSVGPIPYVEGQVRYRETPTQATQILNFVVSSGMPIDVELHEMPPTN